MSSTSMTLSSIVVGDNVYMSLDLVHHQLNAPLDGPLLLRGSPPLLSVRPAVVAGEHQRWSTHVIREAGATESRHTAAVQQAPSLGGIFESSPFEISRSCAVCDSCCLLALWVLDIPSPGTLKSPSLALGSG